ncbi:MAG: hypothetical protein KKH97_08520 [Proteobacteria bacterium]|nr:hypothetical protein [Pseudomonadota bacterium]MBU1713344.1 hypothetical protein [Pseudomonadota bacterium]
MKTLHILRSEPTTMTQNFIQATSADGGNEQVKLYQENIDYNRLVHEIFISDRVICWW